MSSKSTPSTEPFLFLVEVFVRVAGLLTLCFIFQYYSKVRPDVSIWTIFDQYRFFFKICLLTYTKPKLFIQGHLLMSVGSSRKLLYFENIPNARNFEFSLPILCVKNHLYYYYYFIFFIFLRRWTTFTNVMFWHTLFSKMMPNFVMLHAMSINKIRQFPWRPFILLIKPS